MPVELVEKTEQFEKLRQDWNRLAARTQHPSPFLLHEFATAWWKAYRPHYNLRIVVARNRLAQVTAIAPFCAKNQAPHFWLPLGVGTSDYTSILSNPEENGQFEIDTWLKTSDQWKTLHLPYVPQTQSSFGSLGNRLHGPIRPVQKLAKIFSPFPIVYTHGGPSHPVVEKDELQSFRELLTTKRLRNFQNWYARRGPLRYFSTTDSKVIRQHLPCLIRHHQERWGDQGQPALFGTTAGRCFIENLVDEFAALQSTQMHRLGLGEETLAIHLGFKWRNILYWYLPAYSQAFAKRSPGTLLLSFALQEAAEQGLEGIDFLQGLEPYKLKYASKIKETTHYTVLRDRFTALKLGAAKLIPVR